MAPIVVAVAAWLNYSGGANVSGIGAAAGVGLIPLVIAYFNRSGPGTVCTTNGSSCTDEWSPWPFLGVGIVLVLGSVIIFHHLKGLPRYNAAAARWRA